MSNINKALLRWKEVLIITAFIRLLLFLLPVFLKLSPTNLFYYWVQWDGPHYIDIAKNWYQTSGEQTLWIVFSPLYPILIKFFNLLINDFSISAIILSTLLSCFASILLFELTLLDFERRVAIFSVWFLNIFPSSYFLQASYTESLFLTLSLTTIYLLRKNLFYQAGIVGWFTTLTRINGILLLPTLLMETKLTKKSFFTFLMLPLGGLFYLGINYLTFNDPLYFTKPLYANWYQHATWPWVGIFNLIHSIPSISNSNFYVYYSELFFLVLILFFSIYVFLKIRKSYGVYMFINFLFYISAGFIISTPRHALVLFPIFIALGTLRNKIIIFVLSILSLLLLIFYTNLYIQGRWAF